MDNILPGMVTRLDLVRGGSVLDISDEINYAHEDHDGFGMAPLHRITERGPEQHGDTDRGYRLDPRLVNLVIHILGESWDDFYEKRERLLRYLVPQGNLSMRFIKSNGDRRQLDVFCVSGPLFASVEMLGWNIKAGFVLKASDPTWYDPEPVIVTFQLGGGGDAGMSVPMTVPFTVGTSVIDTSQAVGYAGTWDSYPHLIRISGPITNPVITNQATGDKLDFTGTTISAGDYYDIDLRYGYKTVVDSGGANRVAKLTTDSDLSTWRLAAAEDGAESNANSISLTGSGVTAASIVEMSYFTRYIGL